MTNWNRIKEIERLNKRELELNLSDSASWHTRYKKSAYIFVGNLHYDLTEGDLITVFSQFGEVVDCNLIRDKETGDSKGFAFIAFENQKSTNIAVDNMNGSLLLKRTLNVDHVLRYRKPKHYKDKDKNLKNNEYGDIDEDDQTYEQRRKKIWDYEKYMNINIDKYKSISKTAVSDNKSDVKINYNEVNKVNKKYLKKKQETEIEFKKEKNELDKQIEIRKLKRKLLRMKRDESNHNYDERDKDRNRNRNRNMDWGKDKDKRKDNQWIDYGNELRDSNGRLINIEKELKKRKRMDEIAKREQYEKEMEEIKLERKRRKLEKKSKSEILNSKLKKLNKKMRKKNYKKFKGGDLPLKKRKLNE